MTEILYIITAVCVISATLVIIFDRHRTVKIMRSLDKMTDKAIDGSFTEENIDESMLSSVEAKFAKYLSLSELSARNLAAEKEKIKEDVGVNENFQHISLIYYVIETFVIVVLYVLEYAAESLPFGG